MELEAREASRYASRKFLLTVVTLLCAFLAFGFKAITAPEAIDLTKWVLGLYFAGNVGAKIAEVLQGVRP